ncbi:MULTISPECIES: ABC transporter ATP-binding protein [Kitasatospora]|uniref:Putative multidrug ABC transporter ATP-binding and permease protein n=1 Tax=Kitasatospora setae (strain ATCC 33774 / DSM 43861 / JCM 3304 / KCC A-0304 / NBRC 14216 / KM-6054) TaxID=452652 RepID=E4NH70_KITSK|nr:ABC transporter ATP-binding protein [Kitasatospora setae]BAJ30850.1 putative multidrug ABC transporter ATP-binding and permease protein [Kitasatospora setae KM-6054]
MNDPTAGEPGEPDIRSPLRFLVWLATSQLRRSLTGTLVGTAWMLGLIVQPYLLSRAVDDGLRTGRTGTVLAWSAAMLGAGLLNVLLAWHRHRVMTLIRNDATFRTVTVVLRHSTRLGAALPRRVSAGELVTIGISDVVRMSLALTVVGPGVGALVCYLAVAAVLLGLSPLLALVILLGLPLLGLALRPLFARQRRTEGDYRDHQARLTSRFEDLAGGLRVLNGLGGKEAYAGRYREESRRLRAEGYRVGAVTSWIQALGAGLPVLLLAAVTWLGARLAVEGQLTPGQLAAVFGYTSVLVIPVYFLMEGSQDVARALVCARRVTAFLALTPEPDAGTAEPPSGPAELADPESGVRLVPGELTVLASARPADSAAVAARLARLDADTAAEWGGTPLTALPLTAVRDRIALAENEAALFAGTLRETVRGRTPAPDAALLAAIDDAAARDVHDALPGGLDAPVAADGRNLSGGQRQRLRLARALTADPEVLLAVEPTSAVDAHTEAAMAAGLRAARTGRTTLVTSTSPLLLDRADTVHYLVDGKVAATGTHRELLHTHPGYRALVARDADSPTGAPS